MKTELIVGLALLGLFVLIMLICIIIAIKSNREIEEQEKEKWTEDPEDEFTYGWKREHWY